MNATVAEVAVTRVPTFLGVARADDSLVSSTETTADGLPVYLRPAGLGFSLVVEGGPGKWGERKVTEANLTYVAIDRDGKPRALPAS